MTSPKGKEGHHLLYMKVGVHGKNEQENQTGHLRRDKVFPLGALEVKTKLIEEGALITVESNEGGSVIELHGAGEDEHKH